MDHRHGASPWSMQPCHRALPHQWAASSHSTQYSAIPCGHAQPCQLQVPVQFVGAHVAQYSLGPLQPTAPHLQQWTTPMQFQGCSGRHHTAEPARKREINPAYCLVDKEGQPKPFSSVTQLSGGSYEGMLSKIFGSGGAWTLHAVWHQEEEERKRLETSRNAVAELLRQTVSDSAGNDMTAKGVAAEQAEVDTVFNDSFNAFAESIKALSEVKVSATCEQVQSVLVEICSDSRFVAMKLYQIEIQSCLVARQGFLVEKAEPTRRKQLHPQTTGFAIIFNRAALQIDTQALATQFGLTNVQSLLAEEKLHIAYFQPETALPAALSMAREAEKKAADADKKAAGAIEELRQLRDQLQGTTAALTKAIWVIQLRKDDSDGLEFVGNAFQIDPAPSNIDYLKKAIKKEKPNKVQCDADEIDIFSQQQDGNWSKEEKMSASLRATDEDTPYGYIVP